ncbi:hypothetical protein AZI86_14615 [Bdellovibrio bacteriovorus]|uniref:Uncharacterized protein n=1 Tax=Bdellovibrio bacteriovorus TaxID=959 RepID=A0A150WKC5_BDEBC|nr:hypothetical protein [Bdellovibrio bacteriovorus]KYG64035.1 hypothetical protein AZI86_14615 [Bdellovibrio bacteriovorus]
MVFLFFLAQPALAELSSGASDRVNDLAGKQVYHSGPNCYNSVSYVSGFTDFLYQTSSMELKYYLSEYCEENKGTPKTGDILVIGVPNEPFATSFAHAVVQLGDTEIFEKGASTGLYSSVLSGAYPTNLQRELKNTFYSRRAYAESDYAAICAEDPVNCRNFSCRIDKNNSLSLGSACKASVLTKNLKSVQAQLQEISFNRDRDIDALLLKVMSDLNVLMKDMDELKPGDECSIYYLSSWASVDWHLSYGVESEVLRQNPKLELFRLKLKTLYKEISSVKKDSKSRFILSGGL